MKTFFAGAIVAILLAIGTRVALDTVTVSSAQMFSTEEANL
jgi:hypothetical protein